MLKTLGDILQNSSTHSYRHSPLTTNNEYPSYSPGDSAGSDSTTSSKSLVLLFPVCILKLWKWNSSFSSPFFLIWPYSCKFLVLAALLITSSVCQDLLFWSAVCSFVVCHHSPLNLLCFKDQWHLHLLVSSHGIHLCLLKTHTYKTSPWNSLHKVMRHYIKYGLCITSSWFGKVYLKIFKIQVKTEDYRMVLFTEYQIKLQECEKPNQISHICHNWINPKTLLYKLQDIHCIIKMTWRRVYLNIYLGVLIKMW